MKLKENKGKVATGVVGVPGIIIAIVANWGTISNELQEYGVLPYYPADPNKSEWLSNWEKPVSNVPDYVEQKDKTLFGIKADSTK